MLTRRAFLSGAVVGLGLQDRRVDVLARRLLLGAFGGGSFVVPGYALSADQVAYMADQAALLDPAAYELVASSGSVESRTVPSGETYYLVGGWQMDFTNSGFLREPDAFRALPLPEGTTIATMAVAGAHFLICKPALVNSDPRYSSDPMGLVFERLRRLATELPQYDIGASNTGSGNVDTSFPTDFTNGMILLDSSHDVAWSGLLNAAATLTFNLQSEISDSDPMRFARTMYLPFDRTVFPKFRSHGVSLGTGVAVARYVKLDEASSTW